MNWINNNPIVNQDGPSFLLFYAVISAFVCYLVRKKTVTTDTTRNQPTPLLPEKFDVHELAFLRGAQPELLRLVIFDLIKRGYLVHVEKRVFFSKKHYIAQNPVRPDTALLTADERLVYNGIASQIATDAIFPTLFQALLSRGFGSGISQKLAEEEFTTKPNREAATFRYWMHFLLIGLALYKFVIAIQRGHMNVIFLIILCVLANVILFACGRTKRLTHKGRNYFEKVQVALGGLRYRTGATPATANGFPDPMLLATAVFGLSILENTAYGYLPEEFKKGVESSGGCGSSGSGCSSSGGSSCGSSSCGSGCGGCGGGGGD